jgi:hypothetical protein
MTPQQATDIIADKAYNENMGILECLIYMRTNYRNLSEIEQNAYTVFYYEASEMFSPVEHEYHPYSEHSE